VAGAIVWGPFVGMLKAIVSTSVVLLFAFAAVMACRSVHTAAHDAPAVSSMDVTVNVVGTAFAVGAANTEIAIATPPAAARTIRF
jgi:hypothetical protein